MLNIKEIFFSKKYFGLETDLELIEITLSEKKMKLVFNKDNIIINKEIQKVKDEDKMFHVHEDTST